MNAAPALQRTPRGRLLSASDAQGGGGGGGAQGGGRAGTNRFGRGVHDERRRELCGARGENRPAGLHTARAPTSAQCGCGGQAEGAATEEQSGAEQSREEPSRPARPPRLAA